MMKQILTLILAVALSVTLSYFLLRHDGSSRIPEKRETAYTRVMRSNTLQCGYIVWPNAFEIDPATKKKSGINYEIAEEWGRKLGITINWAQEVFYGQYVDDLRTGKIDALCSCDGPLTYRGAAQVDYAHPYGYYAVYLYGRPEDAGKYKTPADSNTSAFRLTMMDGDISSAMASDDFPKAGKLSLPFNADPSLLVANVVSKKADGVILDSFTAKLVGDKLGGLVPLLPDKLGVFPCSFSVKKGEGELLKMIDQGMDLLNNLGSVEKLARQNGIEDLFLPVTKPYQENTEINY